jgi:3-hydroxyacyl-CoA dehydrogenase
MVDRASFFQPGECDAAGGDRARQGYQQGSHRDVDGVGEKTGKTAVLAGNRRGFIGNRMVEPYLREAQFLLEEGASVEAVDQALYDFGFAMGPLAMSDLAGLDVWWRIRKEYRHLEKAGVRQPLVAQLICEQGRYGQKTGAGWYRYDANRRPSPDLEIAALIEKTARAARIERREISAEEIVERTLYALINEGARVLEEGVALRPVDIDIVYLHGYGFPVWRGGPMFYADTVGLPKVLARIKEFEKCHGSDLWAPAPLLERLASKEKTFAEANGEA